MFQDAIKGEIMSDETNDVTEEVIEAPVEDAPKASAKNKAVKAEASVEADVVVDEVAQDSSVEDVQEAVADYSAESDGSLKFTPSSVITAISSSSTTFTFTAVNSFTAGQSVLIQNCIPAAYNGTWTLATASSSGFTVTNSANPGVGTIFGTATAATSAPQVFNTATAFNMWNPWITAQNGDPIGYNTNINQKDWAGAIVFQNGQYNTTQRGF